MHIIRVQHSESFEYLVCKRLVIPAKFYARPGPSFALLHATVKLLETSGELRVLTHEHLDFAENGELEELTVREMSKLCAGSPWLIDFFVGLLMLFIRAYRVITFALIARSRTIALEAESVRFPENRTTLWQKVAASAREIQVRPKRRKRIAHLRFCSRTSLNTAARYCLKNTYFAFLKSAPIACSFYFRPNLWVVNGSVRRGP